MGKHLAPWSIMRRHADRLCAGRALCYRGRHADLGKPAKVDTQTFMAWATER